MNIPSMDDVQKLLQDPWQDIEFAPRDGTDILIYDPSVHDTRRFTVTVSCWRAVPQMDAGGYWETEMGGYWKPTKFMIIRMPEDN